MCSKIVSATVLQIGKGLLDAVGNDPEMGIHNQMGLKIDTHIVDTRQSLTLNSKSIIFTRLLCVD